MFGVDSDDGFEDEAPQRVDAAAGPATVERRLEKWDALARTLSDDEEDGATEDAKDAAAAYARLVEVCGGGPNDWEVVHERVAVREAPSTDAPLLGFRRKGAIVSVEHAREGLWLKLAGEEGWMLAHGRELGLGQLVRPVDAVGGRLEPTEANETAEARVVDSEDLMPREAEARARRARAALRRRAAKLREARV